MSRVFADSGVARKIRPKGGAFAGRRLGPRGPKTRPLGQSSVTPVRLGVYGA
jgi:hypothetical protein